MKCPVCEAEGLKSTVAVGLGGVTCLGWHPYYDEDGKYHSHDPNAKTFYNKCSNGHEFIQSWHTKCPSCDYRSEDIVITVTKPENYANPQK